MPPTRYTYLIHIYFANLLDYNVFTLITTNLLKLARRCMLHVHGARTFGKRRMSRATELAATRYVYAALL